MKKSLFLCLSACACVAHAQTPQMREYCEATPEERKVADAVGFMAQVGEMTFNSLTNTYSIHARPFNYNNDTPSMPICTDEPLYGQIYAYWGRTAFLVGPDRMVTAPHGPKSTFDPKDFRVVFGLRRERLPNGSCGAVNFDAIPAANVYSPPVDSHLYTSFVSGEMNTPDYLYFKLDRPVPGVKPLTLRRSGAPDLGDPLILVGHPARLPLKIGIGGYVNAITPNGLDVGHAPAWNGNSGSPIYNVRKKVVESVAAGPITGVGLTLDTTANCWRTGPDIGAEILSQLNNGPISRFVDHVPPAAHEILVSPRATVNHVKLPNGTLTNATTTFTVSPSPNAGSTPQSFRVQSFGHVEGPQTIVIPSGAFTVAASDAPKTFTVDASAGTANCGSYQSDLRIVRADTGETVDVIPHRFELGMTDFAATPSDAWTLSKLTAPHPTRTLALSNPNPVAVTLDVASSKPWVTVNGGASTTVSLAAVGTTGSTANVTLAIANADTHIALGATATAQVTITPTNAGCSLRQAQTMPVSFTNGIQPFYGLSTTFAAFPQPTSGQTFGAVVELPVDLSGEAPFNVADVDLNLGFYREGPMGVPADQIDTLLRVVLVAPDGTSAMLWDRADAPAGYVDSSTVLVDNTPTPISRLKLDDATTPPIAPQRLAVFNGRAGKGVWKVRLYGMAGTQYAIPASAQLVVRRAAATSPMVFSAVPAFVNTLAAPAAGQTFGAPTELSIDAGTMPAFTVADVNLDVGFYNESGLFYGADLADTIVKLELVAPDNTTAVLWDRNNSTSAYVANETIYYDNGVVPMSVLKLDDATTAPLGGGLLSAFNGHAGAGTWKVRIYGAAGAGNVVPQAARLSIVRTP
ncbi:trypsin-like serine peptidase [Tahibacter soli]|uniref:Serine protease n=1 Tax=Tahibacter soli TaxID=2983605 RepID=A0A9X3YSV2_9GAMM|nr:serine protease [Tahibacter soli]MDC8015766.1 serine protease [Tahibacter soli]